MITTDIRLIGLKELQARLSATPTAVRDRLRGFMAGAVITLRDMVQANIVQYFHSTGPLYQGVKSEVSEDLDGVSGRVYIDDVPYAAIQERGGTVQIPEIVPVNASVLAFSTGARMAISEIAARGGGSTGGMIFAMRTKAHPVTIPEHPYARKAIAQYRQPFERGIREVVNGALAERNLLAAE